MPLFALLFRLRDRVPPGWITAVFLGWYGVQRFTTDLFRTYDREVLGLTGAQFVCVGLVIASLAMAAWLRARSGASAAPT